MRRNECGTASKDNREMSFMAPLEVKNVHPRAKFSHSLGKIKWYPAGHVSSVSDKLWQVDPAVSVNEGAMRAKHYGRTDPT